MLAESVVIAMIPCLDMDRAQRFYGEKLGLTVTQMNAGNVMYLCKDGTAFALYPSGFAGTAQNTAMSWFVTDLDGEMAALRARGVVFEEYDLPDFKTVNSLYEFPGGRVAWFKDTEGNTLGLTQFV